MNSMKGKLATTFISAAVVIGMMPLFASQVHATDGVQYLYRSWDSANKKVVTETRTANCVDYNSSMKDLHQGWYYVNGKHEVNDRVNVSGEVNIIILDGSTLALADGIHVPAGSTLNIYNTPGGENGTFYAVVDTNDYAAIGGNDGEAAGNINIHSGKVIANAYNDNKGDDAAGIGGGCNGNGGTVRIYGGTVMAQGANESSSGGAGIGGGDKGTGGETFIYGGTVTATGGPDGAGIGGGNGASGGGVYIHGGKVIANGGDYAAGIGSGDADGDNIHGGNVGIYGGDVTAAGGCDAAGIGGGEDGAGGNIHITAGTVKATGGVNGAGIGGGDCGEGGTITISGGEKITATGGANGAGIGGGNDCVFTKIEISGGTIEATGGDYAAGIGGGDRDSASTGGEIIIKGGRLDEVRGGIDGAGIGGGEDCDGGNITISGGTLYVYGGTNEGASPDTGGAGIGGGDGASGGKITITGGNIHTNGGTRAAGIGGGDRGDGGEINIKGAQYLAAHGGINAAGIGGGSSGDGGTITITGGKVIGLSERDGAGIGGGNGGDGGTITIDSTGTVEGIGNYAADGRGAGIGGGLSGDGGTITINNGKVEATGGSYDMYDQASHYIYGGAGIGGGGDIGDSGNITINGGDITAKGGYTAPGIGGGDDGDCELITIAGGKIDAQGGSGVETEVERGAAGIGGGTEESGGKINISGGEIISKGGTNAAGIGGGDNADGGEITISGGENITAFGGSSTIPVGDGGIDGASGGAGIGGGCNGNGGKITISGGNITDVKGGKCAACIGGGSRAESGRIRITGGTIFARNTETNLGGGAGIGSGGMCGKKNNTVDITIDGGDITAYSSGIYEYKGSGSDYGTFYEVRPGAAIGAGGLSRKKYGDNTPVKEPSYFAGSIILNGGTINLVDWYGTVIGATDGRCLDGVTGTVEFNGATVIKTTKNNYHSFVTASSVSLKETEKLHQSVATYHDYWDFRDEKPAYANRDDRVKTIMEDSSYAFAIRPCEHVESDYVDNDSNHSITCKNCNYSGDEAHAYGEPKWTWADDCSSASVKLTCACGHEETPDVTVESKKTADGQKKIYTAKATLDGKEYTVTKTVDLPAPTVTKLPSYKDLTYTGEDQPLGTPGEVTGGTLKYALGTDGTTAPADTEFKESVPKATNVGTYYVWCKVFGDDDHGDSVAQSGTVKILKQTVTDPAIPAKLFIEGVTQIADVPESNLYTVTENDGGIIVGEYDVVLELKDTDNYKWIDSDEATHTLKFRIVDAGENIVTVSIEGWTYGETAKDPTVTATYGQDTAVITYAKSQDGPWVETPDSTGIWWVKASIPAGDGYPAGEDTARFEIAKAAPTVTPPTGKTLTYTGEAQALVNAGNVTGGKMLYAVTTEDAAPDDSAYSETVPTAKDTGAYHVWYKVAGDSNHKDYEPHETTAKINADKTKLKAAIADAKDYYNQIKDDSDYEEVADALKDAIEAAEEVEAKKDVAQSEVNDATTTLNDAVNNAKAGAKDIDAANAVNEQLYNLPDPSDVTLDDKDAINAARKAYDGLTDAQKTHVDKDALKKLEDAEETLAKAEKDAADKGDADKEGSKDKDAKNTAKPVLVAKGIASGKKAVNISWKKISGADRYAIYLAKCNYKGKKYSFKRVKVVNANTLKWKKTKLSKKTAYKFYVVAEKKQGSTYKTLAKSINGHFLTGNLRGKYTNPKSLKLSKSAYTLKKGQSATIKGSVSKVRKGKKLTTSHAATYRYTSNNPSVATVNSKGKIRAKGQGTAVIYVQTINGIWKTCKVTVK